MIDTSRLQNFDAMLTHLAATSAPAIHSFYAALLTAGFPRADALAVTQSTLVALLAVPNPTEQHPSNG